MKKCSSCGKSGFFLRLDQDGLCKSCVAIKEREAEQARLLKEQEAERARLLKEEADRQAAENYYNEIVQKYSIMTSELQADSDPIKNLSLIPAVNDIIQQCTDFSDLLTKYESYPYFEEILKKQITYKNRTEEPIKYGHIEAIHFSGFFEHPDFLAQVIADLQRTIGKHKNAWYKVRERLESNARFERQLQELDSYPITFSDETVSKNFLYEMPELKLSSITAKSNYDKLGTFVVIDIETTGLKCGTSEIIEVAAIRFEHWIPTTKFETLIKPKKRIPFNITDLTGITNEMVADAPSFSSIVSSFLDFIDGYNIVGHNLPFDLPFLYKNGIDVFSSKRKFYDTLDIARKTLVKTSKKYDKELGFYDIDYHKDYDVENHKLTTLCDYYEIRDNNNAHRAASDCLAAGILFDRLAWCRTHR